jgi:hypothetical protein
MLVVLKAPLFLLLAPSAKLKFLGAKSLLKAPKWRLSAKSGITVRALRDLGKGAGLRLTAWPSCCFPMTCPVCLPPRVHIHLVDAPSPWVRVLPPLGGGLAAIPTPSPAASPMVSLGADRSY